MFVMSALTFLASSPLKEEYYEKLVQYNQRGMESKKRKLKCYMSSIDNKKICLVILLFIML